MEHRCGARQEANLWAEIWHQGHNYGAFLTRDISQNGLFVRAPFAKLKEGDFVRVKLNLSGSLADIDAPPDIGAIVLHVSDSGIGLMWAQSDLGLHRLLASGH